MSLRLCSWTWTPLPSSPSVGGLGIAGYLTHRCDSLSVDVYSAPSIMSSMTEALTKLGSKIRRIRECSGLSQEAFANKCGLDRTYISMVERGKRNMAFSNLIRIAQGLGVSVSSLTKDIDDGIDTD